MWFRNDKFVSKKNLVLCQWGVNIKTEVWFSSAEALIGDTLN